MELWRPSAGVHPQREPHLKRTGSTSGEDGGHEGVGSHSVWSFLPQFKAYTFCVFVFFFARAIQRLRHFA